MPNKNKMNWRDFLTGFACGVGLLAVIFACIIPSIIRESRGSADSTNSTEETETASDSELKKYVTDKKNWEVTLSDNTVLKYNTPEGWFSLDDQYQDGLVEYYSSELPDTGIVCVGNDSDQYKATMIINARPLSNVSEVLSVIYGEEYNEEEMLYSDTYKYFKDGTESEEADNEFLTELTSADGHVYKFYHHGFDTEYYTNEEKTETDTVHTDEIIGYSDTEDPVEVIVYMKDYDKETGLSFVKEFLGVIE